MSVRFEAIERLCAELSSAAHAPARALVHEVLALHAEGLARALELLGADASARLADDALVGALLLLHGLHPRSLAERARAALARLGASVELLDADAGRVRVLCPAGARAAVEAALASAAPDAEAVELLERVVLIPAARLAAGARP